MVFRKGEVWNPNGKPAIYKLEQHWNRKYAMAKAQAKFRKEEWAFDELTWFKMWEDSGYVEHMGRKVHQFCMVRKDPLEAWGPHNCIIIKRRKHFRKQMYETLHGIPYRDYMDEDAS